MKQKLVCLLLALTMAVPLAASAAAKPAETGSPAWSAPCRAFVLENGYRRSGQTWSDKAPAFALHDMDGDGVPELLARLDVGGIAVPDVDEDSVIRREIEAIALEKDIPIYYITRESAVDLDKGQLTLLPPVQAEGDSNEQCLSVLCSVGDWDALLTGDMPIEGEEQLLAQYDLPDLELFVAGHHGSKYATGKALLEALTPETVLISVGYNSYGHPAPETLDRLAEAGAAVYRTDQLGDLTVYAHPKEVT